VPGPADLLTPEWLGARLGRRVEAVTAERIGMDRGFVGTVLRVHMIGDTGATSSVVAKLGPDPSHAAEIGFYRRTAVALKAPAPRCLYAGEGPDGEPVLLLEDVQVAREGDALAGATRDEAAAVLEAMAEFWTVRGDEPGLRDLRGWGSPPAQRQARYRRNWLAQRDILAAELPDDIRRIAEKLCTSLGSVVAALHSAPAHPLHADLHLDNVLFTSGRPVVLDWGSICLGPPAIDIFAFLSGSLSPAAQQHHFADLVAEFDPDPAAVDHGRRRLLCSLAGVVGWRGRPPTAVQREQALRTASIADGRLVNALRLWDAGSLID
jgi:hypothetical protein